MPAKMIYAIVKMMVAHYCLEPDARRDLASAEQAAAAPDRPAPRFRSGGAPGRQ